MLLFITSYASVFLSRHLFAVTFAVQNFCEISNRQNFWQNLEKHQNLNIHPVCSSWNHFFFKSPTDFYEHMEFTNQDQKFPQSGS